MLQPALSEEYFYSRKRKMKMLFSAFTLFKNITGSYTVIVTHSQFVSSYHAVLQSQGATHGSPGVPYYTVSHYLALFPRGICVNLYISVRKSCTGKMETQRSRGGPANFGCPLRCCLNVSLKICLIKSLELTAL